MDAEPHLETALLKKDLEIIKEKLTELSVDIRRMSEANASLRNDINIANQSILAIRADVTRINAIVEKHEEFIFESKVTFRNLKIIWAFATTGAGASIVLAILNVIKSQ